MNAKKLELQTAYFCTSEFSYAVPAMRMNLIIVFAFCSSEIWLKIQTKCVFLYLLHVMCNAEVLSVGFTLPCFLFDHT